MMETFLKMCTLHKNYTENLTIVNSESYSNTNTVLTLENIKLVPEVYAIILSYTSNHYSTPGKCYLQPRLVD